MSVITLIASAIYLLILPPSGEANCTKPVTNIWRVTEARGPQGGPILTFGPQSSEARIAAHVGIYDLSTYFKVDPIGGNRSNVNVAEQLIVDAIRDVDRGRSGELLINLILVCICKICDPVKWKLYTFSSPLIIEPIDNYPLEFITGIVLNITEDSRVGSVIANLTDVIFDRDYPDTTKVIRSSLQPIPANSQAVVQLNANGSITLIRALDYESGNRVYEFNVSATNNVSQTAAGKVTIKVLNVNDSPVRFVYPGCTTNCKYVFKASGAASNPVIRAVDADNDQIQYSVTAVLPSTETGVIAINETNGKLRQMMHPKNRNLRMLTVFIKAHAISSLPPARNSTIVSINDDFAEVQIEFEFLYLSTSGSDQVLVADLHMPIILLMVYGISKRVF